MKYSFNFLHYLQVLRVLNRVTGFSNVNKFVITCVPRITLDSGSSARKGVRVRLPSLAPTTSMVLGLATYPVVSPISIISNIHPISSISYLID